MCRYHAILRLSFSLTISPQAVSRTLAEALAKWPRDALRPDCQLHDVVGRRIERELAQAGGNATEAQLKQVNALYSLLENRYQTKVRRQQCHHQGPQADLDHSTG